MIDQDKEVKSILSRCITIKDIDVLGLCRLLLYACMRKIENAVAANDSTFLIESGLPSLEKINNAIDVINSVRVYVARTPRPEDQHGFL